MLDTIQTNIIQHNGFKILELISPQVLIDTESDVLDILGEFQPQYIILHDHNFQPDFFDLSTKKLGTVFQKFTNYQVKLAIVGDFTKYPSQTLKDFIYETNRHGHYLLVGTVKAAVQIWTT